MFWDQTYDLSWRMFCVHLRRICILLLPEEIKLLVFNLVHGHPEGIFLFYLQLSMAMGLSSSQYSLRGSNMCYFGDIPLKGGKVSHPHPPLS